jgi:hypothetical protein
MNLQIPTNSNLRVSPIEQFSGRKPDMKQDIKFGFGDYCQATRPNTDNSMTSRTTGCIALLSRGNLTGSVYMYDLLNGSIVTRDQFAIEPMNDATIQFLNASALKDGFTRGSVDPGVNTIYSSAGIGLLPVGMDIDRDEANDVRVQTNEFLAENAGVDEIIAIEEPANIDESANNNDESDQESAPETDGERDDPLYPAEDLMHESQAPSIVGDTSTGRQYNTRLAAGAIPYRGVLPSKYDLVFHEENEDARREIRRQLAIRKHWRDTEFAFTISVKMAMRDRGEEARPVIMAELQQMADKQVWHGMHVKNLSHEQRKRIIRSSMFLKDKYLASGVFDRFKARLVAGGDMQDKSLYDDLSSPTAATSSVLSVAALAAKEGRKVVMVDIGGAFLKRKYARNWVEGTHEAG